MKEWLTVAEAALLVGRHQSRVYRWIQDPKIHIRSRTTTTGVVQVHRDDITTVEAAVKRGRPAGSVSTRTLGRRGLSS